MQMWVVPGLAPRVMGGIGRLIDFAPTVLELAGTEHGGMDGESMLPSYTAGAFPRRDRYAEAPERRLHQHGEVGRVEAHRS